MTYVVSIMRRAQKELEELSQDDYVRVRDSISSLAVTPRPVGCIKLTGREGWRVRVGNFRIIYTIEDSALLVTVIRVGNRRDIYR